MADKSPDLEACTAANAVLDMHLHGLVRNETVKPQWCGDSGKFWYRRDGEAGSPEFVVVTPDGNKAPAFDHARLERALASALGQEGATGLAALNEVGISEDLQQITGRSDGKKVTCDLTSYLCTVADSVELAPGMLASPDGKWAAGTRNNNLFLRDLTTGAERALTQDGTPYYSWAKLPDDSLTVVARKKARRDAQPFQTFWSPDSRFLIAPRVDERSLGTTPFVEWVPADGSRRPLLHEVRWGFTGDREQIHTDYFVFDLQSGRQLQIALPPQLRPGLFDDFVVGWSSKPLQAFLLTRTAGSRAIELLRLDPATGAVSTIIEEQSDTRAATNTVEYHAANIRVLGDGAEIVWYSDRSGFGHLYLYDARSGQLKNPITRGNWLVFDIHAVDEARRRIYFTAGGREPGRDPYYRHLYSASLDGHGDIRLLTEPDADHDFEPMACTTLARLLGGEQPAPLLHVESEVFVDTWSRVDEPPVSVLRSARDGHILVELERADASRLFAAGWRAPVRKQLKAADGETDLYAVYYAPAGVKAGEPFPVIDAAYGGPQVVVTPRNFIEAYRSTNPVGRSALAKLGFGVVTVDGRGTPMRSRQFRNAGYTEFTQVGIDDHIAVIRQLATQQAGMDLERVGIYGWSWGGTFAAQAILSRPSFYKVAVTGAGVYDYAAMYTGQFDNMVAPPTYANGTAVRDAVDEAPLNWQKLDITRMAANLAGRLLIVYADLDENVPAHQAMRLVDALTRAGKPYDLLYLSNRTHMTGMVDGYYIKRTWDYFLEHLRRPAPIRDFVIAPPG